MKLKMIALLLAVLMLLAFGAGAAGILKTEAPGAENEAGNLIGVLITTEVLRNPNANNTEDTVFYGSLEEAMAASISNDRVYAVLKESEDPNAPGDYVFEGVNGIPLMVPVYHSENGKVYNGSVAGEGLSDVKVNFDVGDTGDSVKLEATVYYTESSPFDTLYMNPVYETASGAVFAQQDTGAACQAGMKMSTSMKDSYTKTGLDGKTETREIEIRLSIEAADEPKEYTLLQFGADDTLLSKETFTPDAVPEKLAVSAGTEYLVIKTVSTDASGKETVQCETTVRGDETLTVFAPAENGFLAKTDVNITWD